MLIEQMWQMLTRENLTIPNLCSTKNWKGEMQVTAILNLWFCNESAPRPVQFISYLCSALTQSNAMQWGRFTPWVTLEWERSSQWAFGSEVREFWWTDVHLIFLEINIAHSCCCLECLITKIYVVLLSWPPLQPKSGHHENLSSWNERKM